MGSTQYYLAQTLDGYIAEPDGGLDWLYRFEGESEVDATESARADVDRFLADVGALAMGSATYEILLAHGSEWPYGERPSWVFTSRELPTPEDADVRFASGPVRAVHEEMLAAAGERNVWIVGGGDLASQFAEAELLDELHLTIIPVVLGGGIPTFVRHLNGRLRLTDIRPFQGGVVQLRYDFLG